MIVGQDDHTRPQGIVARCQGGNRRAQPSNQPLGRQCQIAVGADREALRARLELRGKRLLGSRAHGLGVLALGRLVRRETEPLQFTDMMAFDQHFSRRVYFSFQHFVLSEPPHEHGCPAVYKAFRQSLMQGIRQSVLDIACFFLPMRRIGQPAGPVRNEGPGSDFGDARRKRVDVTLGGIGPTHLLGQEILVHMALFGQVHEQGRHQIGMLCRRDAPIIGEGADVPQKPNIGTIAGRPSDRLIL